jgi:hypothetical protein
MSIPVVSVLSGTTNGVITFPDNTPELVALTAAVTSGLTAQLAAFELAFGPAAFAIPGSPANQLAGIVQQLSRISDNVAVMQGKMTDQQLAMESLSSCVQQMGLAINQFESTHSIAVADQLKHNNFQQRESVAALKRNDIEPQPEPSFKETLVSTVKNSSEIHTSSAVSAQINAVSTGMFSRLENYIANSWLVTHAEAFIKNILGQFNINKLFRKAAEVPETVKATEAELSAARIQIDPGWAPEPPPPIA